MYRAHPRLLLELQVSGNLKCRNNTTSKLVKKQKLIWIIETLKVPFLKSNLKGLSANLEDLWYHPVRGGTLISSSSQLAVRLTRVPRLSVVPDSLQPQGLWPTRLLCPWHFSGKNTGAGCHFLLHYADWPTILKMLSISLIHI